MKKYMSIIKKCNIGLFFLISVQSLAAFELLKTSVGAEATALGGAVSATVRDPSAIFWNPAGLANINGKDKLKGKTSLANEADQKFSTDSFDKLFEETAKNGEKEEEPGTPPPKTENTFEMQLYSTYANLTMDRHVFMASTGITLFKGTFGVGLLGSYVPGIEGYDKQGVSTGTMSYGSYAAISGFAWDTGVLKMGITLAGYQENLFTQNYYGGGVNLGVQMTPIPIIHIGAALQNLAGAMQYTASNLSLMRKLDTIMRVTLGITTPPPDSNFMLLLGLESNLDQIGTPEVYGNIGVQIKFAKIMALMAGLRNNSLAMGLGVHLSFVKISYAINQDPLRTGFQHFVDANFSF